MNLPEEVVTQLQSLKGIVATVVTTGHVEENFSWNLMEMRSWCDRNGFHNVEWRPFSAVLVEHGRDEVMRHALAENYDFALQIDADAAPIPPDALLRILHTSFIAVPDSSVVGGYAQLKSPPYLPTIDTGTGTWEPHFPGEGILPVIRTGAHFLLVKPSILRRFGPPWFRTRLGLRPIDALREVDNFARLRNHGKNPLAGDDWTALLEDARAQAGGVESPVGEDSGFCDAVLAVGGKIYVDTDLVIGHVGKRLITPEMLRTELDKRKTKVRRALGVFE